MARRRSTADHHDDGPRGVRRKRRSSPPSVVDDELSQRESTQQSDLASGREESQAASDADQPKRGKKRVKRVSTTDSDQLNQELQDAIEHDDLDPLAIMVTPQHRDKRVRFSDPGPPISAATPIHPSTTAAPSGATQATPPARRNPLQASRSGRRMTLPANFSGVASQDGGMVQFTPLRAVLEDRQRRRLRRSGLSEEMNNIDEHRREDARAKRELQQLRQEIREKDKRVTDLIYELEVQRQFAIDVQEADRDQENQKVRALEEQLNNLRSEVAEQRERHDLSAIAEENNDDMDMDMDGGLSDDDDAGLMLIEPEDINLTQDDMPHFHGHDSDNGLSTIDEVAEGSQADLPDPSHEVQIHQFENAIAELSRDAAEAKAALQILSIELQTLGFTEPEANAYDVLTSIRSAFQHVRNEIEAIMPGDPSTTLENGGLLYALIEKLRDLKAGIDEKMVEVRQVSDVNALLNSQNKGLVSKMADFDNRRQTLEGQWHELDVVSEKKTKEIIELEDELDSYKAAVAERDSEIIEQDHKMDEMETELEGRDRSNERLQKAVKGYRDEIASMQSLISLMEEQHKNALEELKEEHAAVVAELERKLATERLQREQAETEMDDKTTFISKLEIKVEAAETDLDKLRADLTALQNLKDTERDQREAAEEELDEKNASIAELEQKVEAAEDDLEELRSELDNLRDLADSERQQREAAEAEIEEKDGKIADLEEKIHDAGIEANELRQKLFELQVQKQSVIDELQDTAARREEQYNNDIAAEIARREDAEQIAADRNAEIMELQVKLEGIEENLESLTVEKDDLISELEKRVDKLDTDLMQLRDEYETLAEQKAVEIQDLHDNISILNSDVNAKAALIEQLQNEAIEKAQAHQLEISQHEARISELTSEIEEARTSIQTLEATRNSLEARVEDEASQMLDLQSVHANEINDLRNKIENHEFEIDRLRRAVELREEKYTSDINVKNKELEKLQLIADTRLTTISALETQIEALKKRFRDQTLSSRKTIAGLTEGFRRAADEAEGLGEIHADEAETAIREVEEMQPEGAHVAISHERVNVLKHGGKARGSSRRQFDSGIGVADDEDEMEETMA